MRESSLYKRSSFCSILFWAFETHTLVHIHMQMNNPVRAKTNVYLQLFVICLAFIRKTHLFLLPTREQTVIVLENSLKRINQLKNTKHIAHSSSEKLSRYKVISKKVAI